jgi:hypothetical protein
MFKHIQSTLRIKYELGDNDSKIINRVAETIEGVCGPDGMIIPESTLLISRTPPFLNKMENGGLVEVIVRYEADSVSLPSGSVVNAKVVNENRLGAMATYSVNGYMIATILLPNDLQDPYLRDSIIKDHYVNVKILDSQYGTGWKMINAVGQIIETKPTTNEKDTDAVKPLNIREESIAENW